MDQDFSPELSPPLPIDRRRFLKIAAIASAAAALPRHFLLAESEQGMPYRKLGLTGAKVSLIGLGGFHLGLAKSAAEATKLTRTAVDSGINFMDNCWDYHDGKSERWMGEALRDGYRDKVYLMTKIDGRDRKTAAAQIDQSLKRLETDHIDLLQMHEIIRMEDPTMIFNEDGAIHALKAAKKAGKIRHLGFTGHKSPEILLEMLRVADLHDFQFEAVQLPLNVMDAHYDSFEKLVLPELVKRGIGVLGMKPLGSGEILKAKVVSAPACLHYAMNLPTSVVITGCEKMADLEQALLAARSFKPMSENEIAALLAQTAQVADNGRYELYKTSRKFDGTHKNPGWLGAPAAEALKS